MHVFIDHSNVTIGASRAGKVLDPAQLVEQVEHGRKAEERIVVGSHETERARPEWARLGYDVVADPRQGKEIFVDEALHAQLMRTAASALKKKSFSARAIHGGNLHPQIANLDSRRRPSLGCFSNSSADGAEEGRRGGRQRKGSGAGRQAKEANQATLKIADGRSDQP